MREQLKDNDNLLVYYAGHGESSGLFQDYVFSDWAEDAVAVLTRIIDHPPVIVGSSMGGWIAVLIAKRLMEQGKTGAIAGLVLIAPACDFTETLMWPQFPESVKTEIMEKGVFQLPSAYAPEPTPITRALIEDGRRNLVFGKTFQVGCPVHILQGMKDPDVPYTHALTLVEHLPLDPVTDRSDSWLIVRPQGAQDGVFDVRSGASGTARDGTDYASW